MLEHRIEAIFEFTSSHLKVIIEAIDKIIEEDYILSDFVAIVRSNLDITQNKTLKVSLYEALKRTITLGEIPAGEWINEKELSDALNISRTPIRHALEKLEVERLVERIHGSGVVVRGISIRDAQEIYDIRKALDSLATITAAKKMTDEDFDEMETLLKEADAYYETKETEKLLNNFRDFNHYIYDKSEMNRLASIIIDLKEYFSYFRDMSINSVIRSGPALEDHWTIYQGMRNRDWEELEAIIYKHLDDSLKFILEEMERREIE